ncbi:MAG: hypothetical protein AB1Z65_01545 [Candidatus Sulfomarinibacteraceae bacterium]
MRCESCPETASAECIRSCPRWVERCSDRRLENRFLLKMDARRIALLSAAPSPSSWRVTTRQRRA